MIDITKLKELLMMESINTLLEQMPMLLEKEEIVDMLIQRADWEEIEKAFHYGYVKLNKEKMK